MTDQVFAPGVHANATLVDVLPRTVSVEVTSRCNLKCRMCPLTEGTTSSGARDGPIDEAVWQALISELEGGLDTVMFTGFGEPTLNPAFPRMLKEIDDRGVRTFFVLNGTALPEALVTAIDGCSHIASINVSMDTGSADVYRRVRGGKLQKALGVYDRLVQRFGDRFPITASAIAMKSTVDSLPELVRRIADFGGRCLFIQSLHDQSLGGLDEHLTPADAVAIAATRAAAEDCGIALVYENEARLSLELTDPVRAAGDYLAPSGPFSRACDMAWVAPHIDAAGGVYPCCRASAVDAEAFGNLTDGSLADAWNGPAARDFRRRILGTDDVPPVCQSCTQVPVGKPKAAQLVAEIVFHHVELRPGRIRLPVRNVGEATWTADRHPQVGTDRQRNRHSLASTPAWPAIGRAARPSSLPVALGEVTVFEFALADASLWNEEWFSLVVEGEAWLRGTDFCIRRAEGPKLNPVRRFWHALTGRPDAGRMTGIELATSEVTDGRSG